MPITALRCDLEYQVFSRSHFFLHIQCAHGGDQNILEECLDTEAGVAMHSYTDPYSGNRFLRCDVDPGVFRLRYDARVELLYPPADVHAAEVAVGELPDAVVRYLMPSRYCQSDTMSRAAQGHFGQVPQGYRRVQAICDWLYDNVSYEVGITNALTSAIDVYQQRVGVCRDFAHLAITFCRALNIPARLVSGYVNFEFPPQDFHANFEAWLGGRWVMFDPTRLTRPENMVRVGTGPDAKDTAFGTLYGQVEMSHMHVQVSHGDVAPVDRPDPAQATVRRL